MIVQQDDIKLLLGLSASITDEEQAFLSLIHPLAEGEIRRYLKYDPEQKIHTEYLPRHLRSGGAGYRGDEYLHVTSTHVYSYSTSPSERTLQLTNIPLRSITSVHVDLDARHGDKSNAFADDTEWDSGDDWHGDWDQADVAYSGQVYATGGWPDEPGCVKVVYRAGYSPIEFAGIASADSVSGGVITTAGVDGSGITLAVQSTVIAAFLKAMSLKKKETAGFTPGALLSERLGDYSYTVDKSTMAAAGLAVALPDDAKQMLEAYRHYGLARL